MRCSTFLNSGSPVIIEADNCFAVAAAKQSAYEMAYCAFISAALIMSSDDGVIIFMGRFDNRSRFSFAGSNPILLIVR